MRSLKKSVDNAPNRGHHISNAIGDMIVIVITFAATIIVKFFGDYVISLI